MSAASRPEFGFEGAPQPDPFDCPPSAPFPDDYEPDGPDYDEATETAARKLFSGIMAGKTWTRAPPQPLTRQSAPAESPYPVDALGDVLGRPRGHSRQGAMPGGDGSAERSFRRQSRGARLRRRVLAIRPDQAREPVRPHHCRERRQKIQRRQRGDDPGADAREKLGEYIQGAEGNPQYRHKAWQGQCTQIERTKMDRAEREAKLHALGPEPLAPARPLSR